MANGHYQKLDTYIDMITPENIRFSRRLAGPFTRFFSLTLDLILIQLFLGIVLVFCSVLLDVGDAPSWLIHLFRGGFMAFSLLVIWFGGAWLEWRFNGQTPGKSVNGIRVLSADGLPITLGQAILRNLVRLADIALGPFVLIFMTVNGRFMRLGDIVAGTIVVVTEEKEVEKEIFRFQRADILQVAAAIPDDFEVSPELAKLLSLYVHRRKTLSPQRQKEIAFPLAQRLTRRTGFPASTDPDLFLCGLYQKTISSH